MSTQTHTPGPWYAEDTLSVDNLTIVADKEGTANPEPIAFCFSDIPEDWQHGIPHDIALGNARLIAAAPTLAEALRALLETCPCDPDITDDFLAANAAARAALDLL